MGIFLLWGEIYLFKIYSKWRIKTLQYCDGFCHTSVCTSHRHTFVPSILYPPPLSLPIPSLQVVTEHWLWVKLPMAIYFNMVMYIFQCYSLKSSSHPRPLPLSPKACSFKYSISWILYVHKVVHLPPLSNSRTFHCPKKKSYMR